VRRLPPIVVGMIGLGQMLIQLAHRRHDRDRDQVTTAEPADLALHSTLLMRATLAGLAEERVEPIVAAQRDEPLVLHSVAALQDPVDRGTQVDAPMDVKRQWMRRPARGWGRGWAR
jgi:hypothetical protein